MHFYTKFDGSFQSINFKYLNAFQCTVQYSNTI
jgi:hypothetical protein